MFSQAPNLILKDSVNRTWITSIIKSGGSNMQGGNTGTHQSIIWNKITITPIRFRSTEHLFDFWFPSIHPFSIHNFWFWCIPVQSHLINIECHSESDSGKRFMSSSATACYREQFFSEILTSKETLGEIIQVKGSQSSTQLHGRSLDVDSAPDSVDKPMISEENNDLCPEGLHPRAKSMGETFLVCIHNIAENHPYAILRTSINNTASDVIRQVSDKNVISYYCDHMILVKVLAKSQRYDEDATKFVLIEECFRNPGGSARDLTSTLSSPRSGIYFELFY
jgi:hypothetical protein